MAGVFGDSSLFDEFDKERPSVATFISYNQNERGEDDTSKIVFHCPDSNSDSSDWEQEAEEGQADTTETKIGKDEEEEEEMDESDDEANEDGRGFQKKVSKKGSSTNGEVHLGALKYTNHQLQFERDKLRKFVRKIDSSRCVPDEESPTIQILYQNNDFSRKYRAQIESFVNNLISEHIKDQSNETLPVLQLKASTLTCVDLNDDLNAEQRNHTMWTNHAIIGTSHFYIDFQVDTTGWPLVDLNPSLTHSWDIPKYEQVFFDPIPIEVDEEGDKPKGSRPERRKPQCFNCGGDHVMNECKEKKDYSRIRMNRQNFMQNSQSGGPQKNSRYHADTDHRFATFKPGTISDSLREALGLNSASVPMYIYRMRLYGYPPGWLEEAKTKTASGMSMFDKHGRQISVTGETLEEGELEPTVSGDAEIDPSLIIEYPGFTVPLPQEIYDEHMEYEMPPLQKHQLKDTLVSYQSSTKRKGESYKNENVKKSRHYETGSEMDLDVNEGSFPDYYDLANPKIEDTSCFIPPLPSDTPPSRPPLPNETPPSSGSDFKFSPKNPMPEPARRRTPLCLPQPKSDAYFSSDSLEDLEAQYRSLQKQLQDEDSDSEPSSDSQVKAAEPNPAELVNPVVLSSDESSHAPSDTGSSSSAYTSLCQSVGRDYGTPVLHSKGSFTALPERANFSVGIQDHIPFENLPQSTGTYDRMRKLFIKIKQTLSANNSKTKKS